MNTGPAKAKFKKISCAEEKELLNALKQFYNLDIIPGSLEKLLEKTASSELYRFRVKYQGFFMIKKSFWYHNNDNDFSKKKQATPSVALEKAYAISEELRKRNVFLPKVLPNKDGKYISIIRGEEITVFEYIDGKPFSGQDKEIESSGAALGALHRAGACYLRENPQEIKDIIEKIPVEKPYEESRDMYYKNLRADLLKKHLCSVPVVCKSIRENINAIDEVMDFIDNSGVNDKTLIRGIVHNDFNIKNVLFPQESDLAACIDIDQLGVAPYIWDIGNTLASFAWYCPGKDSIKHFEHKARLFLRAYHKNFPLPLSEYLLCLAATQRWDIMRILRSMRRHHYENDRLPKLLPKIEKRLIPRVKVAPQIFSFITEDWIKSTLSDI